MSCKIKILSPDDGIEIYNMLQQIPGSENGFINPANGKTFEEFELWLMNSYINSQLKEIVDGWKVPETTVWFYYNDIPIGMGKIRHFLTDGLRIEGGTLGYSIIPSERGKGYAKVFLSEMIKECMKLGMGKILITVDENNIPSIKTALANRGDIEKTENGIKYIWIEM